LSVDEDVNVRRVKRDRRQRVVAAKAVEPAGIVREQRQLCFFGAAAGGDQVNLGRNERVGRRGDGESVECFGDDLWRETGNREQDTAREALGAG